MEPICIRCKGKNPKLCGRKFCPILSKLKSFSPKKIDLNFSGSSPPELFVGRFNYPYVFTGILSPPYYDEEAFKLGYCESWFKERLPIEDILKNRSSMVYSRFVTNVKNPKGKLLDVLQEVSMATKPCSVEFHLKKKPTIRISLDSSMPPIGNPAPLKKAELEENPSIPKKVDYLVSDNEIKAGTALIELYKDNISVTSMIKLLSAGLLGIKIQRKLTPTRWSVTAVDNLISLNLMKKIKNYPLINDFLVFHDEYIGNHYEILLMPKEFSFEVLEAKMPGSCWNKGLNPYIVGDYESHFGRKTYAENVTGAYYANRLACAEYLEKIRRQASVLILREAREEYWAPCGVGILREVSRNAFRKKAIKFNNLKEALDNMNSRLKLPIGRFVEKSKLIRDHKQQKLLTRFL